MTADEAKWTRFRMTLIFGIFAVACCVLLWRAFELQVLERDKLVRIADAECHRTLTLRDMRGPILDRNGEKLAVSLEAESVFAQPSDVEKPAQAAEKLAGILGVSKRVLIKKLSSKSSFVWIKRQITPREVEAVKTLDIRGVHFLTEHKRIYPNKDLAGHLLGFVGIDSNGLEGLELGFDDYLQGAERRWRVRRDALGRTFLDPEVGMLEKGKGASVTLTIDRRIQYVTEKALGRVVDEFKAKSGMALVVRPQTGEILASAVAPGFNGNVFGRYGPAERRNRIVTDLFDPGSTFKVFVIASALEEGLIRPKDTIFCENGLFTVARHVIHDTKPHGWLTVNQIIKYSSNIGAAKIGDKLGADVLYRYLNRFSFGEKTGIDFPVESSGLLRAPEKWRSLDLANVAFGQGVSVSALQMSMAMSALANGGKLMKPYLVSRITDQDGRTVLKREPELVRQVVSSQTAAEVREMLRMVVTEGGTGTRAEARGYPAAGKTGTAQKLDPVTKTYSDEKYFSSFLGMVPYNDPELVIFVALDEPSAKTYGGTVAAPAFREIAEQVLPMLNVPPVPAPPGQVPQDDVPKEKPVPGKGRTPGLLSASAGQDTQTVPADIRNVVKRAVSVPGGLPVLRHVKTATADAAEKPVNPVMPDLEGMSMRRVLDLMAAYDVEVEFKGSGQAVWQEPLPGKALEPGQTCRVRFEQW